MGAEGCFASRALSLKTLMQDLEMGSENQCLLTSGSNPTPFIADMVAFARVAPRIESNGALPTCPTSPYSPRVPPIELIEHLSPWRG